MSLTLARIRRVIRSRIPIGGPLLLGSSSSVTGSRTGQPPYLSPLRHLLRIELDIIGGEHAADERLAVAAPIAQRQVGAVDARIDVGMDIAGALARRAGD